jgi:hypothetical protein
MKPQPIKKLFAFIIITMFSISFLQAQSPCKGNQVQISLYVIQHSGNRCITMCVPKNQLEKYLAQGWCTCNSLCWCAGPCNGIAHGKNNVPKKKESNKPLAKTPVEVGIASNKIFRR